MYVHIRMRKKKKSGREGKRESKSKDYAHIDDDDGEDQVDVEQGCGLFSSYALVSVLHASSMSVNIYMLRVEEEGPKK